MIRAALDAARAGSCSNSCFSVLSSSFVYEVNHDSQHFHIPVRLIGKQQHKDIVVSQPINCATKQTKEGSLMGHTEGDNRREDDRLP